MELIFLVVLMFGLVGAETNISILHGKNDSGSEVPMRVDSDGRLKVNLNFMNVTTGNLFVTGNLTFGEKITFTLGEMIDNIVDNWIRVTGNLNVTSGNLSLGGKTLSNNNGTLFWGGVDIDTNISVLYGQNDSGSVQPLSVDSDRKLNLKITNLKSSIWEIVGGVTQLVTSGNVFIDGNLNVTGNLSGGSPVKIVGGLNVLSDLGNSLLFINSTGGNLSFNGNLKVGDSDETCSSATGGMMRYNSSLKKMQFCNGSLWRQMKTFSKIYATGGVVTNYSSAGINYRIHTFNVNGSFNVTYAADNATVEYLVVGGGGGMGRSTDVYYGGGGGGGGFRNATNFSVSIQNYEIVVGEGGAMGAGVVDGSNGGNSILGYGLSNNITSTGGGGGGAHDSNGLAGGSGGGAGGNDLASTGGSGNAGGYSPVEGFSGGNSNSGSALGAAGGGGAGGAGGNPSGTTGGTGGAAKASSISGSSVYYAGGGAGQKGGGGSFGSSGTGYNNIANRGMGGQYNLVAGGSGVVIVRYEV